LESAEAASDLVVLLVLELLSAFEALDASLEDVLTEFRAIESPHFLPVSIRGEQTTLLIF